MTFCVSNYENVLCCAHSLSCIQLFGPHRLYPTRLHCPWNFPGKNTTVGCHFLLQRIFLTQGSNPLLHVFCTERQILYHCTTWEAPARPWASLYAHCDTFGSVQFSRSVVSDSFDPMNRSTPGLPVHHHLPEFTQTHIH